MLLFELDWRFSLSFFPIFFFHNKFCWMMIMTMVVNCIHNITLHLSQDDPMRSNFIINYIKLEYSSIELARIFPLVSVFYVEFFFNQLLIGSSDDEHMFTLHASMYILFHVRCVLPSLPPQQINIIYRNYINKPVAMTVT